MADQLLKRFASGTAVALLAHCMLVCPARAQANAQATALYQGGIPVSANNPLATSGGSAPSGTVGTPATGSGKASPVFDAATGNGLALHSDQTTLNTSIGQLHSDNGIAGSGGVQQGGGTGVLGWLSTIAYDLVHALIVTITPVSSQPIETTTAISTTATPFGSAVGSYKAMSYQVQGTQPVCITFGGGTLTAPNTTTLTCSVGAYVQPGQTYQFPSTATPSVRGQAIAAAAGSQIWELTQ